jgi:tetratricopeptide (TPR) repeat protein
MIRLWTTALLGATALPVAARQTAPPRAPQAATPATRPSPTPSFDDLARRAAKARDENRLDEAVHLYRAALKLRPAWDEGWWYLATSLYEKDRFADAREAFRRFLALKPETGRAWLLRGLCDFRVGDYTSAVQHLDQGFKLGPAGTDELQRTARYHRVLLHLKASEFELALPALTWLARLEPESANLVDAVGLVLLRLAMFPAEVPDAKRELVRRAGHAGYLSLARKGEEAAQAYAALVDAYPREPYLHYAYGVFLLKNDADRGLAELRRETEVQPDNVYAHLEIAFELLRRGDNEGARKAAETSLQLAPRLFAAHNALGRALVELGDTERGVTELEKAAELAPDSPEMHFSLARGYQQAGRTEDAAKARTRFAALERKRREARGEPATGLDEPATPKEP